MHEKAQGNSCQTGLEGGLCIGTGRPPPRSLLTLAHSNTCQGKETSNHGGLGGVKCRKQCFDGDMFTSISQDLHSLKEIIKVERRPLEDPFSPF